MEIELDHLVIAARDLAEGAAWLESRLGVPMSGGGKHAAMGTHNRLLSLGPRCYIEVIAIDPEAPAPGRARWFDLDSPAMRERLAAGPALVTWAVRSDDIEAWETERPTAALPDAGCRLEKLVLAHPDAPAGLAALRAAGLDPDEPVEARREGPHGLQAQVRTPRGIVVIHG